MQTNDFFATIETVIGNLKQKRLADVFRIISFTPHELYGKHQHTRFEINYIKKGSCILHLEEESFSFNENEMMIINSHVMHSFEAGPKGVTIMQLEFLPEIYTSFDPAQQNVQNRLDPSTVFSESNKLIKIINNVRIMRAVQRIVNELTAKNQFYDYLVIMYYAELLILIYRHLEETYSPVGTNEKLKLAVAYMRMNYLTEISIEAIANHVGISERYLRKLFVNQLQITPIDYLNKMRMNKAQGLLMNTEFSIKEVCFMCGYQSPQYFSRLYKKYYGINPRYTSKQSAT